MRTSFDKLNEALQEIGFEPENDLTKQYAPNHGKIACWWSDDCCAIILGLDKGYVDFIFDGQFKLKGVYNNKKGCRYTEPL